MPSLINKIIKSLKEDKADANLRRWAAYIIKNKIAIMDLVNLIHDEKPVATRFSWMLGGICETNPEFIYPALTYFFTKRNEIQILNFNRSLAKFFYYAGVPPEIEGEVIDFLFKLLIDSKSIVTTKSFSLLALHKLTGKYPELKNELKICIEDEAGKNSVSFEKQARKILEGL